MSDGEFEAFVQAMDPQLRRALSAHLPPERVADAIAEAFAYAWQHWKRVQEMDNPGGYLYRVAQSKTRSRKQGFLPWPADAELPDYEPGLAPALLELSPAQLRAIWLVHGCGWSHVEAGVALRMSASTVATHVSRALDRLRTRMGVRDDV
jgi:RNA polymerase sigma-70 factor (ECF subfamily)